MIGRLALLLASIMIIICNSFTHLSHSWWCTYQLSMPCGAPKNQKISEWYIASFLESNLNVFNRYMKRSSSLGQLRAYVGAFLKCTCQYYFVNIITAPEPRRKRSLILRATLICLLCVALFYVGWRYRIWETQRGWLDDLENEEDLVMDMTNNTRTRVCSKCIHVLLKFSIVFLKFSLYML